MLDVPGISRVFQIRPRCARYIWQDFDDNFINDFQLNGFTLLLQRNEAESRPRCLQLHTRLPVHKKRVFFTAVSICEKDFLKMLKPQI